MRQSTYKRLVDRVVDCETRRDEAFAVVATSLLGLAGLG
jgi:hypothetical protein